MRMQPGPGRRGLTLLEVIVAITIFFLAIIAIFQLMLLGTDRAEEVRMRSRTSIRCQGKMTELTIGVESLIGGTDTYAPFTDADTDLQYKFKAEQIDDALVMLWKVEVWVKGDIPGGNSVESYLCQYILSPDKRGTTFDPYPTVPTSTPPP